MRRFGRESPQVTGFLDNGTSVTGELQFGGALRIDGAFHGSIHSDGILVIGNEAEVHADIRVAEIDIHGHVTGTVEATRRIDIRASGRVSADISTPTLVIEDGARFVGRSRPMSPEPPEEQAFDEKKLYEGVDGR